MKRKAEATGISSTQSEPIHTSAVETHTNDRALRLPQVCEVTGLRRSIIYQLQSERRFPQRIKLSDRAVGWLEREVQDWLARRIESSRRKANSNGT
jgi:prophage regulatory protein